jgi:RHS repeat-associated protein
LNGKETVYLYGVVSVIQPNGRGTTEYGYAGNEVTVTDPAGKWKRFESDVEGHLVKVTEPNPEGGLLETTYTYSDLGQLLTVNMTRGGVTQTRTWTYHADKRERLMSVTHPESGTTLFSYNNDGTVAEKRDAKLQKLVYEYDADANGRLKLVKRLLAGGSEDICQRVRYYYDTQPFAAGFTQNANGRVAAVETGCEAVAPGRLIEMYSYTPAGAVTKKRLRVTRDTGTVDRDFVYGYGADGKLATVLYPGASVPFTYTYDLMDRPTKMTGPSPANPGTVVDHAKDVEYGAAGQVTAMKYLQWDDGDEQHYFNETRTYDELYQLIHQKTMGMGGTVAEIGYGYSANANNGRILSRTNFVRGVVDGEKVTYQYDSLNRVTSAAGTTKNAGGTEVNTWGQNFSYDGFGNLLSQAPKPGFPDASPNVYVTVNGANNRLSSLHWAYDLNGNTTQMPVMGGGAAALAYDVDNRLKTWTGAAGVEQYGYLADNKRVWKKTPGGVETYYLYGLGGQKLMTCSVVVSPFALNCAMTHVYFGGKVIRADGEAVVQDRLGSVVARGNVKRDYFPYGDEIGGATAGNVDKFGTYMRDGTTGLDYADQRYYAGSMSGRFLTADPYEASGGAGEPGSWNRYPYVGGDPVNANDPRGLKCVQVTAGGFAQWADDGTGGGCDKAGVNGDGSMTSHKIDVSGGANISLVVQYSTWPFPSGQVWAGAPSLEIPPDFTMPMTFVQPSCGVNPVSGAAYLSNSNTGNPGELRPGRRGGGRFGARRRHRFGYAYAHEGIDIAGTPGKSPIVSALPGVVISAGVQGGYGNTVVVDMGNGYTALYSHLDSISVSVGQAVGIGEQVGVLGQTGNASGQDRAEAHVHFEIIHNGQKIDPFQFMAQPCPWGVAP